MSLTKGLVFAERPHIGNTAPTTFEDTSRFGNDGVETAITKVQLPSGLWVSEFNGSTSEINFGLRLSFVDQRAWTLITWVKITGTPSWHNLSTPNKAWNYQIMVHSATSLTYYDIDGNSHVVSIGTIADAWHQVALTMDSSRATLGYKDGDSKGVLSNVVTNSAFSFRYTGISGGGASLGLHSLYSIYNRALSPQEIADLFESERRFFGV